MSVARAEAELAAVLLIELMIAVAEEEDREDEPAVALASSVDREPARAVA